MKCFALSLLLLLNFSTKVEAKICFLVYQLADNNLDFYLRQDYKEISESPAVVGDNSTNSTLRTWVYHDARDDKPLPNTINQFGIDDIGFAGSRYIRYDHGLGQMKVEVDLRGEVNSDLPSTVQNFFEHALADCVAHDYMEFFAVFASHAGGFAGYGGDKNKGEDDETRRRKLLKINLQINRSIAAALRAALDNTVGPNSTLDVLGFDACLMQAAGAADDYTGVAKYILASEAVEPGHGWAYNSLNQTNSSLDLATNILDTFLTGTHGRSFHQSPKTLSILDVDKFQLFVVQFETLCAELLASLENSDVSLYSFVSRARASSVAYEGLVDAVGTTNPSGLDLGDFLTQLDRQCNPTALLGIALKQARDAYADMFVATGVGPGTSRGTGLHITWPNTREYNANVHLWNPVLFEHEDYRTNVMPNYRAFLQWFLTSSAPRANPQGTSVCSVPVTSNSTIHNNATDPNALILNDTAREDSTTGFFQVETEISANVSQMVVEYGIDLTTPLRPFLRDKGYTPRDDEYLFLSGGDVVGDYNGSAFVADWDQNFYFLNITSNDTQEERGFEALYVFDEGDGSKKVPVYYFPEDKREEVSRLGLLDYLFFDSDFWEKNGGRFGFLKFSVDEAVGRVNENLNLFVSNADNGFAEQPRESGGMIVPLIYVDAFIQGQKINTLPGGFNQTVIEWKTDLNYNLLTTHADRIFSVVPDTDAVIVNVYAFNHGDPDAEPDSRSYDVIRRIRDITDDYVGDEPVDLSSDGVDLYLIQTGLAVATLLCFGWLL